jgi:hypothetical protein
VDETSSAAALGFATGLVAVALYEFAAIRWRRVPTITKIIKDMPLPARAAVIAVGVAAWLDHFITGWVL